MNDDATFIAKILAVPADEGPRLAYAAWLEQHDAARADYLRAEAEWARTRGEDAAAELRRRAASLDSVWVARLSRPPLGACLERVRFHEPWDERVRPALTSRDLAWLERRFKLTLPADYRAFLLNYNGGAPEPAHFRIPDRDYAPTGYETLVYLSILWEAADTGAEWECDLVGNLAGQEELRAGDDEDGERWRDEPYRDLIQIGKGPPTGGLELICLGVGGAVRGEVYFVAPWLPDEEEDAYCQIAPSFAEFLALLRDHDAAHIQALKAGDVAGVRRWLDGGGDPNEVYHGAPLVTHAVFQKQPAIVRELLARGVTIYRGLADHAKALRQQEVIDLLRSHQDTLCMQRLHIHDDPVHWEQPPGFDRAAASARFQELVAALSESMHVALKSETGAQIQDASFHSQLLLPSPSGQETVVRFSNFGDMVTIRGEESMAPITLAMLTALFDYFHYMQIPARLLEQPYTGSNPGVTGIATWWIRYFDWV